MKILNIKKVNTIILLLVVVGTVIGYTIINYFNLFQASITPIQKVFDKKPMTTNLVHKVAYFKGKVVDYAIFLDGSSYQLQDKTGTIWVLKTFDEIPEIGKTIKIKGEIVYQPIFIGDKDIGEFYIVELERLKS